MSNKAARAEIARDFDLAFKTYLSAAQAFLAIHKSSTDAQVSIRAKAEAAKCLTRAEKLKKNKPTLRAAVKDILDPEQQNRVLELASNVNGLKLSPWTEQLPSELATFECADPDHFLARTDC